MKQNPVGGRPDKKPETLRKPPSKTSETISAGSNFSESAQNPPSKTSETPSEAELLGLVATWSIEFGYISVHDPTTGEWHDLRTGEAPGWARWEAGKRKEIYKSGNRKAYRLTAKEMEAIWEAEHPPIEDGIVEEHPVEEEDK